MYVLCMYARMHVRMYALCMYPCIYVCIKACDDRQPTMLASVDVSITNPACHVLVNICAYRELRLPLAYSRRADKIAFIGCYYVLLWLR